MWRSKVISNLLFLLFNKFQNLKSQLLRHLYSVTEQICLQVPVISTSWQLLVSTFNFSELRDKQFFKNSFLDTTLFYRTVQIHILYFISFNNISQEGVENLNLLFTWQLVVYWSFSCKLISKRLDWDWLVSSICFCAA